MFVLQWSSERKWDNRSNMGVKCNFSRPSLDPRTPLNVSQTHKRSELWIVTSHTGRTAQTVPSSSMQLASRVPYVTSQILTLYKGPLKAENLDLKTNIFESWLLRAPNIFLREELLYLIGKASPSQWYEFCINSKHFLFLRVATLIKLKLVIVFRATKLLMLPIINPQHHHQFCLHPL